jgi:hypothetical protein
VQFWCKKKQLLLCRMVRRVPVIELAEDQNDLACNSLRTLHYENAVSVSEIINIEKPVWCGELEMIGRGPF